MPLPQELVGLRSPRSRLLLILCLVAVGLVGGLAHRGTEDLWDVDRAHFADSTFVETRGYPSGWIVLETPENRVLTKKRFAPIPGARSALAWLAWSTLGLGVTIAVRRKARGIAVFQPCSPALRLFSVAATWLGACGLLVLEMDARQWWLGPGLAVGLIGPAAAALVSHRRTARWVGLVLAEILAVMLLWVAFSRAFGGDPSASGAFGFLPFAFLLLSICLGLEALFRIAICPAPSEPRLEA